MENLNDNKDIQTIVYNYDNLDTLDIIRYLTSIVINDIEYMNSDLEEQEYYYLGNNKVIKKEDFESLVSIMDTIEFIKNYNKEGN